MDHRQIVKETNKHVDSLPDPTQAQSSLKKSNKQRNN